MKSYQIEVAEKYSEQIKILDEVRLYVSEMMGEYFSARFGMDLVTDLCRSSFKGGESPDYVYASGYKGIKKLEVRYRVGDGVSSETINTIRRVRSQILINGKSRTIGVPAKGLVDSWKRFIGTQSRSITVAAITMKALEIDRLELAYAVELFPKLVSEYKRNWDELMEAIYGFNCVGNGLTRYYKLIVRLKLDRRLDNPFKAIGRLAYYRVRGGDYKSGARFTQSIKSLSRTDREDKLTRYVIRKARLGRLGKMYLAESREIEGVYSKHLKLKSAILLLVRDFTIWRSN